MGFGAACPVAYSCTRVSNVVLGRERSPHQCSASWGRRHTSFCTHVVEGHQGRPQGEDHFELAGGGRSLRGRPALLGATRLPRRGPESASPQGRSLATIRWAGTEVYWVICGFLVARTSTAPVIGALPARQVRSAKRPAEWFVDVPVARTRSRGRAGWARCWRSVRVLYVESVRDTGAMSPEQTDGRGCGPGRVACSVAASARVITPGRRALCRETVFRVGSGREVTRGSGSSDAVPGETGDASRTRRALRKSMTIIEMQRVGYESEAAFRGRSRRRWRAAGHLEAQTRGCRGKARSLARRRATRLSRFRTRAPCVHSTRLRANRPQPARAEVAPAPRRVRLGLACPQGLPASALNQRSSVLPGGANCNVSESKESRRHATISALPLLRCRVSQKARFPSRGPISTAHPERV